jgi:hypothetical protein
MAKGKHVFCQKPMTNAVYEARFMAEASKKTKLATQVATGNASSPDVEFCSFAVLQFTHCTTPNYRLPTTDY